MTRVPLPRLVEGKFHALRPGPGGGPTLSIHHTQLARLPSGIGAGESTNHVLRGESATEKLEPLGTVEVVVPRLGGERPDPPFTPGNERANGRRLVETATPQYFPSTSQATIEN